MNLLQPHNPTRRPPVPSTGSNPDDWFALNDWVGIGRASQRDDVVKVEALLANAADYSLKRNQGQTGYWGSPQDAALRSYQPRNDLPEIGADVHASNARWIAAIDRGNGFSTYPDLFARSITEHGDSAVAEVRDLVDQYEALHPGDGAKLTGEIVAALPDDATRRSFLGTEATLEGNNIVARECKASISASRLADILEHKGGASQDGLKNDYMTETRINLDDGRRRYSDYSMGPRNSDNPHEYSHINTASQRADGSLTGREQRPYDDIAKKLGEDFVKTVPKFKEGDDPEAYAKTVRAACDELVRAQEDRLLGPAEGDPTETGQ